MSRVANSPVALPKGVDIKIEGLNLSVKGGKGTLDLTLTDGVGVNVEEDVATITYEGDSHRAMAGTTRSLLANMVIGVSEGYEKSMEIVGTGYRVTAKGTDLEFALGYSHPVLVKAPEGVSFTVESPTKFKVSGIDKQVVGETAAKIRKLRKIDPYKGKGVRFEGEVIRRKAGKAGK